MGMDRIDYANTGVTRVDDLTSNARKFLDDLEGATEVPIEYAGTGFGTFDAIQIAARSQRPHLTHV